MSYGIVCRQSGCKMWAKYRFTWPGRNESFICEEHANKAKGIASVLGMHLQFIELTEDDHKGDEGMKSLEDQRKETKKQNLKQQYGGK